MSTFGFTSVGASTNGISANIMLMCPVTSGVAGTIKSITASVDNYLSTDIKAVICDSDYAILANGISIPVFTYNNSTEWVEFFFATPPSVSASTTYYLCLIGSGAVGFRYDAGASARHDTTNSYSSPTSPTDSAYLADYKVSIYATYVDDDKLLNYYFTIPDGLANVQPDYPNRGQSFSMATAHKLTQIRVNLQKTNSPTGNCFVKLYAHSGTYGTSSVPTGSALATSAALDTSTITTSRKWYTFTFSGDQQYAMQASTNYTFDISHADNDNTHYIQLSRHVTSPTHDGNFFYYDTATTAWIANSAQDSPFYVIGTAASTTQKTIVASSKATSSVGDKAKRILAATSDAVASVGDKTKRIIAATAKATATVSRLEVVCKTIAAAAKAIGILVRNPKRVLTAAAKATATVPLRNIDRIIAVSAKATGNLLRDVTKTISATVKAVAALVDLIIGYYIERKDGDAGSWAGIDNTYDMNYTDEASLIDGTKYWYRIRKYLGGGSYTAYSNEVYVVYVGAGTFFKTIAVAANVTAAVIREAGKILSSATVDATSTVTDKTGRVIAASTKATASVTDKTGRIIAVSVNAVSTVTRKATKTITASATAIAARIQAHTKTISASVKAVAASVRELQEIIHTYKKTITAAVKATTTMIDKFTSAYIFGKTVLKITSIIQKYIKRTGKTGRLVQLSVVASKPLEATQNTVVIKQYEILKKLKNPVDWTYVIVKTTINKVK